MPGIRTMIAAAILALATTQPAASQATDRIGVPGPIEFAGTDYRLSWVSEPSGEYVKQEYVPAGQDPKTYTEMMLIEYLKGDVQPVQAAGQQVKMLQARKASDPLVNMNVIRNDKTGEVLLDFIMSGQDPGGRTIVEWNAYRYARTDAGLVLFAVSRRAYGDDARKFLEGLKSARRETIDALAQASMPKIRE